MIDIQSRFQGCLLGLAIGDALGAPVEFLYTMDEILERFGPDGLTDFEGGYHPAGTYTDDTQMTLAIARSLVKVGRESLDDLMNVMSEEFVAWSRSPENNRAPGHTCMAGCRQLEAGVSWREAGVPQSKGCGSAMRTAPIGLYYYDDEPRLVEIARASSIPTHGHPTALAAAVATALLVSWAVKGQSPTEFPERLAKAMRDMGEGEEVAALVERIPLLIEEPPEHVLCDEVLGESWTGEEAVASALYCFCRSPDDYRRTVLTGTNTVGDSDSIACIAGAISGAYNGVKAIPESWRRNVEDSDYLHDTASQLYSRSLGA